MTRKEVTSLRFARDCGFAAAVLTVGWVLIRIVEPLAQRLDCLMI